MKTIAIAHSVKIAYPVYLAWLRNGFWGAKQIVVKTPAYPAHTKGQPTMRTLAIKHSRPNYERQFGSRFLTSGWYRRMVVTHYHSHKTTIKTLRGAQWIYYGA